MSTFIVHRNKEFVGILADSLGHRALGGGTAPVLAPKLVHVAPCVYAAHVGTWQPAMDMLHQLHSLLSEPNSLPPADERYDWLVGKLADVGQSTYEKWKGTYGKEYISIHILLVFTGDFRNAADAESGLSATVVVWESPLGFVPHRAEGNGLGRGPDNETTSVIMQLMAMPEIITLLTSSPLALAQGLDAMHTFISKISVYVSEANNILIIGDRDEYSLLKGNMIRLPNRALLFG